MGAKHRLTQEKKDLIAGLLDDPAPVACTSLKVREEMLN
jgi:hypothetical protein